MLSGFKIKIEGGGEIQSLPDSTILESIEANGIECHFHCRDGFCGACRCSLKKGTVEYKQYPLAYVGDDEILTCCTYPTSNIVIEID
ncbi:MAG: 2Fe-2S iron-sulfur cluster binding domain-containing protein [Colwellia sp.]|nr:2Fe-2S iron-sulfur cluster binding domain-containing protein [Colwellia sp.]